jgi:hypothetical protein
VVEAREIDPPARWEPLNERLLTTHEIADAAGAWQISGWYQRRWVIVQLFGVMKSQGLQLEDSQIGTAERMPKLAAVAVKTACIDIQLTPERDGTHQLPVSMVLTEPEIDTIKALVPTLEGSTDRQKNPHPARSLGGNLGHRPPGRLELQL